MPERAYLPLEEVQKQLRLADWDDLYPRLLLFAQRLHRRYGLHLRRGAPKPEDLAHDAVDASLQGRRKWPADLPAFTILCGIVRSQVSNYLQKRRPDVSLEDIAGG